VLETRSTRALLDHRGLRRTRVDDEGDGCASGSVLDEEQVGFADRPPGIIEDHDLVGPEDDALGGDGPLDAGHHYGSTLS
jgi:hypothetical protein